MATEITRLRQSQSVFLSPEKEKLKKKELQGEIPLTHAVGRDTTTARGVSGEDSVQAAQRGQVRVQAVKAIPHNSKCVDAPADFSSDDTKIRRQGTSPVKNFYEV